MITELKIILLVAIASAGFSMCHSHPPIKPVKHHKHHHNTKRVHPKAEPTPSSPKTYGQTYKVNPDGSWQWQEEAPPTPAPSPTIEPWRKKPESF